MKSMGNFSCVVFLKSSRDCVMLPLDYWTALLAILFLCFLCLSYSCLLNLLHIILCLSIPVFLIKSLTSLKSRSIHPLVLPSKVNCRPPIGSLCAIFLNNCLLLLSFIFNINDWINDDYKIAIVISARYVLLHLHKGESCLL